MTYKYLMIWIFLNASISRRPLLCVHAARPHRSLRNITPGPGNECWGFSDRLFPLHGGGRRQLSGEGLHDRSFHLHRDG